MLRIATAEQIRKLEADWIASCGESWSQVLMELAGQQAAKIVYNAWLSRPGKVILVCGSGNNGGDGFVIARYLHLWQVPVAVFLLSSQKETGPEQQMSTKEANVNKVIAKNLGIEIKTFGKASELSLTDATIIVDALLGTGLDRPVDGLYKEVIERINDARLARELDVIAVDVPSGVNSDNGQIMGVAVKADITPSFGYLKAGLLCHPAADLCGDLHLIEIGLPPLTNCLPEIGLSTVNYIASLIPERKADSNKGTFGTLLTIAGSIGMSGAAF